MATKKAPTKKASTKSPKKNAPKPAAAPKGTPLSRPRNF